MQTSMHFLMVSPKTECLKAHYLSFGLQSLSMNLYGVLPCIFKNMDLPYSTFVVYQMRVRMMKVCCIIRTNTMLQFFTFSRHSVTSDMRHHRKTLTCLLIYFYPTSVLAHWRYRFFDVQFSSDTADVWCVNWPNSRAGEAVSLSHGRQVATHTAQYKPSDTCGGQILNQISAVGL